MSNLLTNLQRRLDQAALEQARAEVVRMAERIEQMQAHIWQLEEQLQYAQADAECWYEHSQLLTERLPENLSIGITQEGALVIVGDAA